MRLERPGRMFLLTTVAICAALSLPAVAAADDGERREVRKAGTCTGSSRASIWLRAEDGEIRIEFEIDTRSSTAAWSVILLHERRIVFRGRIRARDGRSVRLRRTVADFFGRDTIVVRASGPRVETCRVSATV